jgi:hypothetical protein
MKGRFFIMLGLIFCMPVIIIAQNADFQWWPLVNISKKTGHYKFFIEEQVRFRNNASELYVIYSDIGVYYTINNHINFGPIWRPWWNKMDNGYDQINRLLLDLNLKNEYGNFEYSYRMRYQALIRIENEDPREQFSRNKFELKYNGWKVKPIISTELFIPLFKTTPNFIDKIRNTLGFEIKVTEHSAFIPLLMYIKDRSALDYQDLFIIGGGYYLIF